MAELRPPPTPLPRIAALVQLVELAKAEAEAAAGHRRATYALKAACLAHSYHLLPPGHPAYLEMRDMAEAVGRYETRVSVWCQQILRNRPDGPGGRGPGLRDKITAELGYDPVQPYDLRTQGAHHAPESAVPPG